MISENLFLRIKFNLRLYFHCKEITTLYKNNTLQKCLEILDTYKFTEKLKVADKVSATYLSKRISLINRLLGVNNCLANSMCLFLAIKNRRNISFIIGVSDDFIENSFSHCWVEVKNIAVNEKRTIMKYRPVISIST